MTQRVMKDIAQWGVAMPGGAEAMVHFRDVVEKLAVEGSISPLVILDLDMVNALCSAEWEAVRDAIKQELPSQLPWLEWAHTEPSQVVLPSGGTVSVDRGAEQGDPNGSVQMSVCLGVARRCAHEKFAAATAEMRARGAEGAGGEYDLWYIDDGQVFVSPGLADHFLKILDEELAVF